MLYICRYITCDILLSFFVLLMVCVCAAYTSVNEKENETILAVSSIFFVVEVIPADKNRYQQPKGESNKEA